ncbi:hypothetical protein FDG2_3771 [Candidatus Protofrankia californiensis]|uniref:Uncharacterized protein n=1 Tax=Candidatus Protofrankia californiensis TaxID=1839754 RepID=A0A1C3P0T7_9ACTN|nr:hypothetical protein FDG2_3771 [Candidatus Protofrankia californiensis]
MTGRRAAHVRALRSVVHAPAQHPSPFVTTRDLQARQQLGMSVTGWPVARSWQASGVTGDPVGRTTRGLFRDLMTGSMPGEIDGAFRTNQP